MIGGEGTYKNFPPKTGIATSHIPVILLTAKAGEESIVAGLECGADDYITKPFSTKILCARIKNLIELRRQLQDTLKRELHLQPAKMKVSAIDDEFLQDINKVLGKNISDPDFSVDELSRKLYMNRVTLYKKRRNTKGSMIKKYLVHWCLCSLNFNSNFNANQLIFLFPNHF